MINFTDITGLASDTIAICALVLRLPGVARLQKWPLALLLCTIAIVTLIPFGSLPLAAYLRGVTGDLSIISLVLLALAILKPLAGWSPPDDRSKIALLFLIVLAAAGLYPMALGLGYFDPYSLGYGNGWCIGGLLLLALAACYYRRALLAFAIALAVLAWSVGWYESTNLWDYLLDPWLAVYALGALLRRGIQTLLAPRRGYSAR